MVAIDFIGLTLTIFLAGLRYPHYVISAVCVQELGRFLMIIFLHGHIESIIAAGAFGAMTVTNYNSGVISLLIIFSGPLANFIVSSTAGGVEFEKTTHLLNPVARLKYPFAVVNLRLALISVLVNVWQFI